MMTMKVANWYAFIAGIILLILSVIIDNVPLSLLALLVLVFGLGAEEE